ncbi:MAG: hypothetical protein JWP58_1084 [Hymenobacter sp.]|nr:hypothetical protein [Hymenobacter sp.]
MPFLEYTRTPLSYPVAKRLFGSVEIPQNATLAGFKVEISPDTHELSAVLSFRVAYLHEATGEPLPTGRGLSSYLVELVANNNSAVDVTTGEVRYLKRIGAAVETWDELLADGTRREVVGGMAATAEPLLRQGDALREALKNPLVLADLFAYHVAQANGPRYDKFR